MSLGEVATNNCLLKSCLMCCTSWCGWEFMTKVSKEFVGSTDVVGLHLVWYYWLLSCSRATVNAYGRSRNDWSRLHSRISKCICPRHAVSRLQYV